MTLVDREQTLRESQNIYDNPEFFAGYKKLRDGGGALNETLEQPALWSLVGDSLAGSSVLDLGCGFGTLLAYSTIIYGAPGTCLDQAATLFPNMSL